MSTRVAAVQPGEPVQLEPGRELSGDKASRIVEAMRVSVASRGIAGSTFDHVARAAGVSRGLLHYYFGTKDRLLVEVVRRESDVQIELLEAAIADAGSAEDVIAAMVRVLEDFLGDAPISSVMFFEMIGLAQRNEDIAAELAELGRRTRAHLADALRAKSRAGVLELRAKPEIVSTFLYALADGITIRRLSEPELDIGPLVEQSMIAARALLS